MVTDEMNMLQHTCDHYTRKYMIYTYIHMYVHTYVRVVYEGQDDVFVVFEGQDDVFLYVTYAFVVQKKHDFP